MKSYIETSDNVFFSKFYKKIKNVICSTPQITCLSGSKCKHLQTISSLSSVQSFMPSHLHVLGMHWVFEAQDHWNSPHATGSTAQF